MAMARDVSIRSPQLKQSGNTLRMIAPIDALGETGRRIHLLEYLIGCQHGACRKYLILEDSPWVLQSKIDLA